MPRIDHARAYKESEELGWQHQFRASTLKVGFSIHLTKPMLEFLCAVSDDVTWDRSLYHNGLATPDHFITTEASLIKRGLIRRKADFNVRQESDQKGYCGYSFSELTPAGEAVVQLVKLAGIFVEADAAICKRLKPKKTKRRTA